MNAAADPRERRYAQLEIVCVLFWFLLDGFWLFEWKAATYGFSAVALAAAVAMLFHVKREKVVVLVACADFSWLLMNVAWAVGDLSKIPWALEFAKALFALGAMFCARAFVASDHSRRLSVLVLSRLRVLRWFSGQ